MKTSDLMRHTVLSRDPAQLAEQCAENFRDGNLALGRRVVGSLKTVAGYVATGSTSSVLQVYESSAPPAAIVLVNARETNGSAVLTLTPTFGVFFQNGIAGAYEPSGLTASTKYDLTFLILE